MPVDTHRIDIGALTTRCEVLATPDAAQSMRLMLELAVEDRLPAALARAAEPELDGLDGVVRVRHLAVRLDLGETFEPGEVASLLAARIAASLRRTIASAAGEVRTWASHDEFAADYLSMRLGLRPQAAWPFDDFAALEHLPAERAAAELIRTRPILLALLAGVAASNGSAESLVQTWPLDAQAALARALLRADTAADEPAALAPALELIATHATRPAAADPEFVTAAALRLAVRALGAIATSRSSGSAVMPARSVVIVAAAVLWSLVAAERPPVLGGARSVGSGETPGPDGKLLSAAYARVTSGTGLHGRLEEVTREILSRTTQHVRHEPDVVRSHKADGGPVATQFAGLALLMPSVVALNVLEELGETGLAVAAWRALADEDLEQVSTDQALAQLFPVDPREIDLDAPQPVPQQRLIDQLPDPARETFLAADPRRQWTALLVADFASRLRGLQGSSHEYLRREFLRRPGTIERTDEDFTVRFDELPLAVVLRMAGHGDPPMKLAHLSDRRLILDLGGRS